MVTPEEARAIFEEMVKKSGKKYRVEYVVELHLEDPIYYMLAQDEKGKQIFPGEVFPSIRKRDGELVDFEFPCPA